MSCGEPSSSTTKSDCLRSVTGFPRNRRAHIHRNHDDAGAEGGRRRLLGESGAACRAAAALPEDVGGDNRQYAPPSAAPGRVMARKPYARVRISMSARSVAGRSAWRQQNRARPETALESPVSAGRPVSGMPRRTSPSRRLSGRPRGGRHPRWSQDCRRVRRRRVPAPVRTAVRPGTQQARHIAPVARHENVNVPRRSHRPVQVRGYAPGQRVPHSVAVRRAASPKDAVIGTRDSSGHRADARIRSTIRTFARTAGMGRVSTRRNHGTGVRSRRAMQPGRAAPHGGAQAGEQMGEAVGASGRF